MNKSPLNKRVISSGRKHLPSRGMTWSWSIIWGSPIKIRRISQRPNSLGQISAWVTWGHSNNESCLIKHLLVAWQNTSNRGNSLHSESTDIVEKNTTHNQRPARLTYPGKNQGFPANQKGSGKNKGWKRKIYTPGKSKTWKGSLGKKGYPGGLKTRKGGPGKN